MWPYMYTDGKRRLWVGSLVLALTPHHGRKDVLFDGKLVISATMSELQSHDLPFPSPS